MKKSLPSSILVLLLGVGFLSPAEKAAAQDPSLRVVAHNVKIAGRHSSDVHSAILQLFFDPKPVPQGWTPPSPPNEIGVISVRLTPSAPQRLIDQLDACLEMAQILRVRPGHFRLSLTVRGFSESDIEWKPSGSHVLVTLPDLTGVLGCDLR